MINDKPHAILITGPTSSGKSALAIELSNYLPIKIISADSASIYIGMDIGTSKPSAEELRSVQHYLINIRDPKEYYSVANFYNDAIKIMFEITNSGYIPVLVGGSMLYFKVLLEGISPLPPKNDFFRNFIINKANYVGWNKIYEILKKIDPESANNIHYNDHYRIIRALEVFFISGITLTSFFKINSKKLNYNIHKFAILPTNRNGLYKLIKKRFYNMLNIGFEEEVKALFLRKDINSNTQSMRCIGYKQMWSYLSGDINYEEMIFRSICATRQLAKKQITWINSLNNFNYIYDNKINFSKKEFINYCIKNVINK